MAPPKLYIGLKVRELREAQRATQAAFAARIGISTSYLNQIENNQRPVSGAVLVALAEKFEVDLSSLASGDGNRLLSALTEALADPIFENYKPNLQELKQVVQNTPGLARALISCHQIYRRKSEQLTSASTNDRSIDLVEATPYEEVRDFFHFVDNYIHALDVKAEELARDIRSGARDAGGALSEHLERRHGVRTVRADDKGSFIRHYEARSKILYLNPYLPPATANFQMAYQIAKLENSEIVDGIVGHANFRTAEAGAICRIGLFNYIAGATILPYSAFHDAAQNLRHDLDLLSVRFGASLEQVAHRLSTLQRPSHKGTPIFFARIDRAGNITKRHSAAKLQFARFGAACPLWNVYRAFETPGRIIRQLAEAPDGNRYLCVATELAKGTRGFHEPERRYAIALGCEISYASNFVYADGLNISDRANFDPIGISCRLCERETCAQRAHPPLSGRLAVDPDRRDILPYSLS